MFRLFVVLNGYVVALLKSIDNSIYVFAREYRRKKLSEETESQRQVRLNKKKIAHTKKTLSKTESEKQVRLEKDRQYHKRKFSVETQVDKSERLEKFREHYIKG